ncbi:TPA: hypothetical protein ACH3X1_002247 [Trebouxia sp. C0004]
MLLHNARPAPFDGACGHPCWRQQCVNAERSNVHASAFVKRRTLFGRPMSNSSTSRIGKRARTSTALPGATDLQLQLPNDVEDSSASPDIFQSALNALSLGSPTESYDGYDEFHEDISLEQGQAAAQVGKAVYEVLKLSSSGKTRRIYVKRRDLLRANHLQPRDLRRIDPSLSITKTSPNISVKEHCLLVNLGGVRAIITAHSCLLFEPSNNQSKKFLECVTPRLTANEGARVLAEFRRNHDDYAEGENEQPPFELEMVEGALMVATGRLDAELLNVTKRVTNVLQMLPKNITPVNLEELRRVKQQLVELESRAENIVNMLEELMDDEDEMRDMNLSSRPGREEKRRVRERDRLEREMERERDIVRREDSQEGPFSSLQEFRDFKDSQRQAKQQQQQQQSQPAQSSSDTQRRASSSQTSSSNSSNGSSPSRGPYVSTSRSRSGRKEYDSLRSQEDAEEGYQEAEAALEIMEEAEAEEAELEEVEDLLEYYLQRATTTQSEAERLLAGSRDLEESIGVSLSARRFEVNRLELTLSMAGFAAGIGAMIAGIFGMNLKSTLEDSIIGFWGTTAAIVLGCFWIFVALYKYTCRRRIL